MRGDTFEDGPNDNGWEDVEMTDSMPTLEESDVFVCAIHDILPEWCVINSFQVCDTTIDLKPELFNHCRSHIPEGIETQSPSHSISTSR